MTRSFLSGKGRGKVGTMENALVGHGSSHENRKEDDDGDGDGRKKEEEECAI